MKAKEDFFVAVSGWNEDSEKGIFHFTVQSSLRRLRAGAMKGGGD